MKLDPNTAWQDTSDAIMCATEDESEDRGKDPDQITLDSYEAMERGFEVLKL